MLTQKNLCRVAFILFSEVNCVVLLSCSLYECLMCGVGKERRFRVLNLFSTSKRGLCFSHVHGEQELGVVVVPLDDVLRPSLLVVWVGGDV